MSIFRRIFRGAPDRARMQPLYGAVVAVARQPVWYVDGQVPDTVDNRFEMVAAMMSLVLIRLESEGQATAQEAAWLTETFVDDMDGQLRESGIGDVVVGKHIGKMMSALGGRMGAYREGLEQGGDLEAALVRNLYRGEAPEAAALGWTAAQMRAVFAALQACPAKALLAGEWPQ